MRLILILFLIPLVSAVQYSTDCGYWYEVSNENLGEGNEFVFTSHWGFDGQSSYGKNEYCLVGFQVKLKKKSIE